jgi:hypothetical protein
MHNLKSLSPNNLSPKSLSPESLTNEALLRTTLTLVAEERKLTTEILWHLHEIQVRKLYAEQGYSSLFEYVVQVLGYSEAAAGRRISAMKLLVEVPEIEPALKDGSINLSTLSTIQGFVQRKNSQRKSEPVSRHEKKELVLTLQGKSRRECERELARLDPNAVPPKENERVVGATQTEIRFVADDALMEKLKRIRELDAHVTPGASYLELFHRMADVVLKKLDPLAKENKLQESAPPAELSSDLRSHESRLAKNQNVNPRFIPAAIKRAVWRRDRSQCTFVSSAGRRCSAKFGLQIDHRIPVALGGTADFENLRLLCRAHNQYEARNKLGPSHYC